MSRRFCGVWTIGNPASRGGHSKPLKMSEGSRIPYGANSVLAAILRLAVAGLRVFAHTGRADGNAGVDIGRARARARAEMSPGGQVLSDGQTCRGFLRSTGAARFSDAVRSARFTGSARSATVTKSTFTTVLTCCQFGQVGIVQHVGLCLVLVLVAGFAFWLLTGE